MASIIYLLFISFFSLTQVQVIDGDGNYTSGVPSPQLGSLVTLRGEIEFTGGVYFVTLNIQAELYIEEEAAKTYNSMLDFLHILEHGGIRMSFAQLRMIEQQIVELSYSFADLFKHVATGYIQKTFNVSSIEELEQNWRDLVYRSLSKVTITKLNHSVVPALESRVVQNNTSNGKTLGKKIVNHPKFKSGKRERRGLIDLGGALLHTLFGVAQDSDIKTLEEKEDDKLNKVIKATRTIEIVAERNNERVGQALIHIKNAIERLQPVAERENRIEAFVQLESILEHLSNVAHYLLNLGREVETRITLLQEGLVPPIITSDELKIVLVEGERKFPNLKFPYAVGELKNSNLAKYLKVIHAEPTNEPYVFILSIPYVGPFAGSGSL